MNKLEISRGPITQLSSAPIHNTKKRLEVGFLGNPGASTVSSKLLEGVCPLDCQILASQP